MLRKIICLIMAVFTLLSAFTVLASATITGDSGIMADLATLKVDGVPFSEEGYPVNSENDNMYVLAVVEQGFSSTGSSPNFAFYIYLYNPSCIAVNGDIFDAVQASYIDDCKEEKYTNFGLELLDKSDDYRFLKFKVYQSTAYRTPVSYLYEKQESNAKRIYHIASVRLLAGGEDKTFPLNKSFVFSGFEHTDTLSCYSEELGSIQVEMHPTNWISPNAGYKADGTTTATIYDHYEINSVYFTLPRSYVDGTTYDAIKYIGAAFDAYHTTPIIVAAPSAFDSDKGQVTKNAILNATNVNTAGIDVFDMTALNDSWFLGFVDYKWGYTENANIKSYFFEKDIEHQYALAYYFENEALEGYDFKHASHAVVGFTAEEFEAYFNARVNDEKYDYKLYNAHEYIEKDFWLEGFDMDYFWQMSTYFSNEDNDTWYRKLTTRSDSYAFEDFKTEASHVELIKDPSQYVTITDAAAVANDLFISQQDVAHFSKVCAEAVAKNEVVVLLRFGFGDYSCSPIVDVLEATPEFYSHYIDAMAIEKWVYFDVNLLHIAFMKNKQTIVVPVVSNTVDAAGDGVIFPDPSAGLGDFFTGNVGDPDDKDDWLKKIIMIIGIVLLVVALFFLGKLALKIFGGKQTLKVVYGPPPEEKKRKRKWFRR